MKAESIQKSLSLLHPEEKGRKRGDFRDWTGGLEFK